MKKVLVLLLGLILFASGCSAAPGSVPSADVVSPISTPVPPSVPGDAPSTAPLILTSTPAPVEDAFVTLNPGESYAIEYPAYREENDVKTAVRVPVVITVKDALVLNPDGKAYIWGGYRRRTGTVSFSARGPNGEKTRYGVLNALTVYTSLRDESGAFIPGYEHKRTSIAPAFRLEVIEMRDLPMKARSVVVEVVHADVASGRKTTLQWTLPITDEFNSLSVCSSEQCVDGGDILAMDGAILTRSLVRPGNKLPVLCLGEEYNGVTVESVDVVEKEYYRDNTDSGFNVTEDGYWVLVRGSTKLLPSARLYIPGFTLGAVSGATSAVFFRDGFMAFNDIVYSGTGRQTFYWVFNTEKKVSLSGSYIQVLDDVFWSLSCTK